MKQRRARPFAEQSHHAAPIRARRATRGGEQRRRILSQPLRAATASRRMSTSSNASTRSSGGIDPCSCSASSRCLSREQPLPLPRAVAERKQSAVGLAGVGERLALAEIDFQQPLTRPSCPSSDGFALAVVEDVRRLVHHEVLEATRRVERGCRQIAGRLLAAPTRPGASSARSSAPSPAR